MSRSLWFILPVFILLSAFSPQMMVTVNEPSDDGEIVNEQDVVSPKDSEDPESSEEEKDSNEVSEADSDDSDE